MKNFLLVALTVIALSLLGCKEELYKVTPPAPTGSYFPETVGSTWKYRDSIYGEATDTAKIYGVHIDTMTYTITGETTDYNARICYNAAVSSKMHGAGSAYFFANNHVYALLQANAPLGFTSLEVLLDTAAEGHNWPSIPTQNTLLNGKPVRAISTIMERNITRVVGGTTFTNVVHTSVNILINSDKTTYKNIAYYDFYLAKGVGLIEKDAYVYGCLNEVQTIVDYKIAP